MDIKKLITVLCIFAITLLAHAQTEIALPAPNKTGGKPLMEALNDRQSLKTYVKKEMDKQTLSNLLWATYGFNREDKRVVPSSQNRQEIDLYVMFEDGVYFYDAKANVLKQTAKGDFRKGLGNQAFVNDAVLNFLFVANLNKASNRDAAIIDSGFLIQNAYLFCASSDDLGTVARGSHNRKQLHSDLGLTDDQEVILTQAVGYIK